MKDLRERVDPQLQPAMDFTLSALGSDFMGSLDAPRRRVRFAEFIDKGIPPGTAFPEVKRTDRSIVGLDADPEIPIRVYSAPTTSAHTAGILFMHGGGFTIGSIDQEDSPAAALAAHLGCIVISVGYRLAPEHPAPAQVRDCYAALRWMSENATQLGVDTERIAAYGHSAGGGLAASVAQISRDRHGPKIAYQMLCYPMLDNHMASAAFGRLRGLGVWDIGANTEAWRSLLGRTGAQKGESIVEYAVAAHAQSLAGLPPTFIDVGDLDILLDQDLTYAQRLMEAGIPVELHVYPGAYHGFDAFAPQASVSQHAIRTRWAALRRALQLET